MYMVGNSRAKTEWNERTDQFIAVARAEIKRAEQALDAKDGGASLPAQRFNVGFTEPRKAVRSE